MDDLDKKIAETLSADDRELMEHFGEQGILGQLGGLFHGRLAWLSMVTFVVGLIVFAVGAYAAWQFTVLDNVASMFRWGAVAWAGFMSMIMIKLWSWMRMESNRVIREVKRVELQIARVLATVNDI